MEPGPRLGELLARLEEDRFAGEIRTRDEALERARPSRGYAARSMSDTTTEPVTVERDGDLAVVTISAPPLNLFDEVVFSGLERAVDEVEENLPARPALPRRGPGRLRRGRRQGLRRDRVGQARPRRCGRACWRMPRRLEVLPIPTSSPRTACA